MQVRCDLDPKHEEDDEEEAILPMLNSMPPDSVGAKARVLMAKGRKLSTIYSKVSAISGASTVNSSQVWLRFTHHLSLRGVSGGSRAEDMPHNTKLLQH